jgi:hypothetical protein
MDNNSYFHRSIRTYSWESFKWEIIYQSKDSIHTLNVMEPYFIQFFDSYKNGYNATLGGNGGPGVIYTEEQKERKRGKNNSFYGKTHTKETKERIGAKSKLRAKKIYDNRIREGNHPNNFINCPHCEKNGQYRAMKRWHFDNCKYLTNNSLFLQ